MFTNTEIKILLSILKILYWSMDHSAVQQRPGYRYTELFKIHSSIDDDKTVPFEILIPLGCTNFDSMTVM